MKRLFLAAFFALIFSWQTFAHETFKLVSAVKKTVAVKELETLEKTRTNGKVSGADITFQEKEISLVVTTGPEDDMLSYRLQGVRNPNVIVPPGARLKILFINADVDMRHDIRFGHVTGEFPIAPEIGATVGTEKLTARSADDVLQAEEIVIEAVQNGAYKYFCSVRGHAKGGMWGNILVGTTSTKDLKTAERQVHVHSADEENEGHSHDADSKKPTTETKPAKKPENVSANAGETDAQTHGGHQTHNTNHEEHGIAQMRSVTNLNDPMTRESSGTSWNPDSSPMYGRMKMFADGGMAMLMGGGFVRYTSVGSRRDLSAAGRGDRQRFDAPTMFMGMYSRPLTKNSQIGVRAMISLDPIFQRGYGYPLLYQSGETFRGEPLHDRQHPHDFISELAVTYSYKFDDKNSFYLYGGLPGEPALGPPTFMHRVSAMNMPDAPIGHHWQDATHITWGVVTAGFAHRNIKLEASTFKGREPDENRWNVDRPKLDSYSARLSWNPTRDWALQVSHGYLRNPEPSEPAVKIKRRTTASAMYNKTFNNQNIWANTFVFGQNFAEGKHTNSYLYETNYEFFKKNNVFGRFESVEKSGHDLALEDHHEHDIYNVKLLSVGYLRDIFKDRGLDLGIGGQATLYRNPEGLSHVYGGRTHGGFQIFFRFRPSQMK